jgi:hypothetical protein
LLNSIAATGFLRTWRSLPYVGPAFIDTLRDTGDADDDESTLVVYHTDWTPQPALEVIEENRAIIAAEEAQSTITDA